MKRRDFIRTAVGGSLLSLLPRTGVFAEGPTATSRPNVLFLFSDQHNATISGFGGNPDVKTPALDRLAASGMRFDRAYCPDGVCCPSRSSMMSGQYPRTHGELLNEKNDVPTMHELTSLQSLFKRAGYYTFNVGKRHLLPPIDVDWDFSAGHLDTEIHDTLPYWTWIKSVGLLDKLQYDWSCEWNKRFGGDGHYGQLCSRASALPPEATMEAFTEWQTTKFLKSPQAKKQPFFAWSTFYRPHQPYTPQQKFIDQIDFKSLHMPATLHQNPDELPPALAKWRRNTKLPWNLGTAAEHEELYRQYIGYYYALMQEIDSHIHNILECLEQEGLAENTIVIYASDHGDFVGNHGLVEKGVFGHNFFEEILRVPLIFRWPGRIPAGTVRPELVELMDIYPTLAELCNLTVPTNLPPVGQSLAGTLQKQIPTSRPYVISENWSQATVITPDFKYGQWLDSLHPDTDYRSWNNMLTQRSTDPSEIKNLIADPAHAATQKELQGHLTEWVGKVNDSGRRAAFDKAKKPYTVV
jgi:arylsulfatase A-like enzyme